MRFFGGASGVEGDQARQKFALILGWGWCLGVCQIGPAVGLEDGGVEFVVQVFEDADQTLRVNGFFFGR